jgi:OHCU decarboxylase
LSARGEFLGVRELDTLSDADFVAALSGVYEHSPWVAARTAGRRPFATLDALAGALSDTVAEASAAEQDALIEAHPDLAGRLARAGHVADASRAEQSGLGLDRLSDAEYDRFDALNRAYRARFGFPFVIAVRHHTRETILSAFEQRLLHDRNSERRTALSEINKIARLRLLDRFPGTGA